MKLKIKWIGICIATCLTITILTSSIPINGIRLAINQIVGFIAGVYCMSSYLNEVEKGINKMTFFQKIKSMNIEELAEFFESYTAEIIKKTRFNILAKNPTIKDIKKALLEKY